MESMLQETEAFLRKSISEEQLAIAVYLDRKQLCEKYKKQCEDSDNIELSKKFEALSYTFEDIANEEELHVGQFREMLDLIGVSDEYEDKGEDEAKEDIDKIMHESFIEMLRKFKKYV